MDVSIIVRTRDEGKNIGLVLEKIFSQKVEGNYEVVIVDSGSSDNTIDIARNYKTHIYCISPSQFSYGYALNYGIQHASGGIIACLSAHCPPLDELWLSELIRPIQEGRASATFGRQMPVRGLNPFEEVSLNKHFPPTEKKSGRLPFSNANCAFKKELWEDVRFDEEVPSWEDYLWYLLLVDKYRFQYCPKAAVYHTHPLSIKAIFKRAFRDGKAFKVIKRKYKIDLLGNLAPFLQSKIRIVATDIKTHAKLFMRERYLRHLFLLPIVKLATYAAYWRGYRSVR